MEKLIVRLKQHTPLIHFQGNQTGATLRATDVKPRLDRWLIKHAFDGVENYESYKNYLNSKDVEDVNKALKKKDANKRSVLLKSSITFNYSINIKCSDTKLENGDSKFQRKVIQERDNSSAPMFFGARSKPKEKYIPKYLIYPTLKNNEYDVEIVIKGQKGLLDKIIDQVDGFFFLNNFMTRQSKGYGSFTVYEIVDKGKVLKLYKSKKEQFKYFDIKIDTRNENYWQETMRSIDLFYRCLRSGINIKDRNDKSVFYFKSCLFHYVKDVLKTQWDKKLIKHTFLHETEPYFLNGRSGRRRIRFLEDQIKDHTDSTSGNIPDILDGFIGGDSLFDYRDMLGLSDNEQWFSYGAVISKKIQNVSRIPSAIKFKPIIIDDVFRVYILIDKDVVNELPYGKSVTIKFTQGKRNKNDGDNTRLLERSRRYSKPLRLDFPKRELFEIEKYVDWVCSNAVFFRDGIDINKPGPENEGKILGDIFNQLHNNKSH